MPDTVDHVVNTGKVMAGGVGVASATYITTDWIAQATEYATLTAAVATTIYFIVATIIAIMNWYKGKNGNP